MKHLYYSIPAFKHNVFKYEGAVDDKAIVDDLGIEINEGVFVKITEEYLGDRIWEDGTPYVYTPKQIVATKTRDDRTITMTLSRRSTETVEFLARKFAEKNGWMIHFFDIDDPDAWVKAIVEHAKCT